MSKLSAADIITIFNKNLDEFVCALASTFPEINDFKMLKSTVKLTQTMDPKLLIKVFNTYVYTPYHDEIMKKNESFFLKNDFMTERESHKVDLNIIEKLKNVWEHLDSDNKELIWQHLQVLTVLTHKYLSA